MQFTSSSVLPSIISAATTLEQSLLMLSEYVLSLQKTFNNVASNEAKLDIVTIDVAVTPQQPLVTIDLKNISVNFNQASGALVASNPFSDSTYAAKTTYPWNRTTAIDCLFHLWLMYLSFEKDTTKNPEQEAPITAVLTTNINFNEPIFTFAGNGVLPIIVTKVGTDTKYTADEYLVGTI